MLMVASDLAVRVDSVRDDETVAPPAAKHRGLPFAKSRAGQQVQRPGLVN
jgi:hypothetical protein